MNKQELHEYAVRLIADEFPKYGFNVESSGEKSASLTFRAKKGIRNYAVKVKASRDYRYNYILKENMTPRQDLLIAFAHFIAGKKYDLYFIRSIVWLKPNAVFKSRDYVGNKSEPEYGIQLSRKNLPMLEQFRFANVILLL